MLFLLFCSPTLISCPTLHFTHAYTVFLPQFSIQGEATPVPPVVWDIGVGPTAVYGCPETYENALADESIEAGSIVTVKEGDFNIIYKCTTDASQSLLCPMLNFEPGYGEFQSQFGHLHWTSLGQCMDLLVGKYTSIGSVKRHAELVNDETIPNASELLPGKCCLDTALNSEFLGYNVSIFWLLMHLMLLLFTNTT